MTAAVGGVTGVMGVIAVTGQAPATGFSRVALAFAGVLVFAGAVLLLADNVAEGWLRERDKLGPRSANRWARAALLGAAILLVLGVVQPAVRVLVGLE